MTNAFDPGSEPGMDAGSPEPGPPGASPGGPTPQAPPGGGPILAMLGRQQMGPPVTAPGPGNVGQGMMLLTQAHGLMAQALQMFPGGSPQSKDILDSMKRLGRHMAQEAPGAGAQQTGLMDLFRNVVKNALLQRIMQSRSQGVGGGPGAQQPGGEPGSAMPGIPAPSTPLPGT